MTPLLIAVLATCVSAAPEAPDARGEREVETVAAEYEEPNTWSNRANFYVGAHGGVAIPAGAPGIAPTAGFELGVANSFGFGFGLQAMWMQSTPGAPFLNIPPTKWGLGAMIDIRFYFQTLEPLTLYPNLALGFVAGPAVADDRNAVLPLINPGFGARVKFAKFYVNFEFGLAGFTIPYVSLALGFQGDRAKDRRDEWLRVRAENERRDAARRARARGRSADGSSAPHPPPAPLDEDSDSEP